MKKKVALIKIENFVLIENSPHTSSCGVDWMKQVDDLNLGFLFHFLTQSQPAPNKYKYFQSAAVRNRMCQLPSPVSFFIYADINNIYPSDLFFIKMKVFSLFIFFCCADFNFFVFVKKCVTISFNQKKLSYSVVDPWKRNLRNSFPLSHRQRCWNCSRSSYNVSQQAMKVWERMYVGESALQKR